VLRKPRFGITLFEIMLVMGVLVLTGAICLPLVAPMLASNDLQAARDLVRARWTEMRTRAVAEGRAYRFALMEKSGKFRIAPDDPEFWGDSGQGQSTDSDKRPWVVEENLPGKVQFATTQATTINQSTAGHGGNGGWKHTLTFLPDGTAREDVQVAFGQGGTSGLRFQVHGHTGAISAGSDTR
jgi:Tfp pilus assembly protein FimT